MLSKLLPTGGLLLCWQTNKSSSFCSLSAAVPADVILFSFLLLTSSSYFQSAAVPGWTFNEFSTIIAILYKALFILDVNNFPALEAGVEIVAQKGFLEQDIGNGQIVNHFVLYLFYKLKAADLKGLEEWDFFYFDKFLIQMPTY